MPTVCRTERPAGEPDSPQLLHRRADICENLPYNRKPPAVHLQYPLIRQKIPCNQRPLVLHFMMCEGAHPSLTRNLSARPIFGSIYPALLPAADTLPWLSWQSSAFVTRRSAVRARPGAPLRTSPHREVLFFFVTKTSRRELRLSVPTCRFISGARDTSHSAS